MTGIGFRENAVGIDPRTQRGTGGRIDQKIGVEPLERVKPVVISGDRIDRLAALNGR